MVQHGKIRAKSVCFAAVRGTTPQFVRAAGRDKAVPASRYDNIGFRVARLLP